MGRRPRADSWRGDAAMLLDAVCVGAVLLPLIYVLLGSVPVLELEPFAPLGYAVMATLVQVVGILGVLAAGVCAAVWLSGQVWRCAALARDEAVYLWVRVVRRRGHWDAQCAVRGHPDHGPVAPGASGAPGVCLCGDVFYPQGG